MMSDYDLLAAWFGVADWCAFDLAKVGYEGMVLKPLGEFPHAACFLAQQAAGSGDFRHRKMGALLAGWIVKPEPDLLENLFRRESARDAALDSQDIRRMDIQAVVEDLVFSAARWSLNPELRPRAMQFLVEIVEQTVSGKYWNSASYAMATVLRDPTAEARALLERFTEFAEGDRPDHPCEPSLCLERQYAEDLMAGVPGPMSSVARILEHQEEGCHAQIDPRSNESILRLCEYARGYELAQQRDRVNLEEKESHENSRDG